MYYKQKAKRQRKNFKNVENNEELIYTFRIQKTLLLKIFFQK
jgi:hypothetical protein